jgi:hypothetical protein
MPCFIAMAATLGLTLFQDAGFLEWFEEKLKEKLKAKSHKDLKKKLDEAYQQDARELKILFQMLLAEHRKPKGFTFKREKRKSIEISGVV